MGKFVGALSIFVCSMVLASMVSGQEEAFGRECGSDWERTDGGVVVYSYVKYWDDGGECAVVDEEWKTTGCLNGYDYCVVGNGDLAEVHVKRDINSPRSVVVIQGGMRVEYSPSRAEDSFGSRVTLDFSVPTAEGNTLTYEMRGDDGVLELSYVSGKLKESFVLDSALSRNVRGNLTFFSDIYDSPQYDNREREHRGRITLYGQNGRKVGFFERTETDWFEKTSYSVREGGLGVTVEYQKAMFPLTIDPTTQLGDSSIVEDGRLGRINSTPQQFTQNVGGTELRAGTGEDANGDDVRWRSAIDWNLTSVPDTAVIVNVTEELAILDVDDDNNDLNLTKTNFHLYELTIGDAGNFAALKSNPFGHVDGLTPLTQFNITFNDTGVELVQEALENDPASVFTHGVINGEDIAVGGQDNDFTDIVSKEHSFTSLRPLLYVDYTWMPLFDNVTESPPSPVNYSDEGFVQFNTSVYFGEGNTNSPSVVFLNVNGTNYSASNEFAVVWNVTIPLTTFGNTTASHSYYWFANETDFGVANTTETFSYNVTQNVTAPPQDEPPTFYNVSESPPSPQNWSVNVSVMFNITVLDDVGVDTVFLNINGTNHSASNLFGNVYNVTLSNSTLQGAFNYTFSWFMNDTAGQANQTGEFVYTFELFIEEWQLAVLLSLFGSAGLMVGVCSRLSKRHEGVRVLCRLMVYLLIGSGLWASSVIAEASNVSAVVEQSFMAGMYVMLFMVAYELVDVLWVSMGGSGR